MSCSSSADSSVWEHLRPPGHTAVLRAKHLHLRGFLCSSRWLRVPAGTPGWAQGSLQGPQGGLEVAAGTPGWAQGHRRDPVRHRSHPSPRAAHYPSVSPKQGKAGGSHRGHSTAPQAPPELETYISPRPFSHSNRLL